jgi:hypothetical protein
MTGLEIIQYLWEAGKMAYEIATGLKKKKEEDRKKIAELFDHIGKLLHETYVELNNNNYPYGHCRQIEIFGEKIKGMDSNEQSVKSAFPKILGEKEAEKLGNLLITAHEVERLQGMLNTGEVDKKELYKLEESSGEFIAASKLVMI